MPAQPRHPLSVPAQPNIVAGARHDELVAEMKRKLAYALRSFNFWRRHLGDAGGFNRSLAHLRLALAGTFDARRDLLGLHSELLVLVQHRARQHADRHHAGPVSDGDLEAGARETLSELRPRRGRPVDHVLRHHVEGLMALIQESCGLPVLATRAKGNAYDPQGSNSLGRMLIDMVRHLDPQVSTTTIVNIIIDARRRYAGKHMPFSAFFPGYGMVTEPC